jgi:hypothetical protein
LRNPQRAVRPERLADHRARRPRDAHAENNVDAPNLLLVRINYRVRATNTIGNLVYPFYIREGR